MQLVILLLIVAIVLVAILLLTQNNRFNKKGKKDKFKNHSQLGSQRVGKVNKGMTYQQVAKDRNLEERKNIAKDVNPSVTKSITATTKDLRDNK